MPQLARDHAQGGGQVGLADPGRPEKDDVAALRQKPARRQLVDQALIQARLGGEVELRQPLEHREAGELEIEGDGFAAALLQLSVQQVAEEVGVGPAFGRRLLADLVQVQERDGEPQLLEGGAGLGCVGEAHGVASAACS